MKDILCMRVRQQCNGKVITHTHTSHPRDQSSKENCPFGGVASVIRTPCINPAIPIHSKLLSCPTDASHPLPSHSISITAHGQTSTGLWHFPATYNQQRFESKESAQRKVRMAVI